MQEQEIWFQFSPEMMLCGEFFRDFTESGYFWKK